jgi:hypothetical protein
VGEGIDLGCDPDQVRDARVPASITPIHENGIRIELREGKRSRRVRRVRGQEFTVSSRLPLAKVVLVFLGQDRARDGGPPYLQQVLEHRPSRRAQRLEHRTEQVPDPDQALVRVVPLGELRRTIDDLRHVVAEADLVAAGLRGSRQTRRRHDVMRRCLKLRERLGQHRPRDPEMVEQLAGLAVARVGEEQPEEKVDRVDRARAAHRREVSRPVERELRRLRQRWARRLCHPARPLAVVPSPHGSRGRAEGLTDCRIHVEGAITVS